jgi:hypothetical protein
MFHRLGLPLCLILSGLALWVIVARVLRNYTHVRGVNNLLKFMQIKHLKTTFIIFMWIIYLPLFIGALINWDNINLLDEGGKLYRTGKLSSGDVFNIVMGFIFFVLLVAFPLVVYHHLNLNGMKTCMPEKERRRWKEEYYYFNEEFREDLPVYHNYFLVALLRRMMFAFVAYGLGAAAVSTFQLFINCIFALLFIVYLFRVRPFKSKFVHYTQVFHELLFVVLSYFQLLLTDHTEKATTKFDVGWAMIVVSIVDLLFPNLFLLLREWSITVYVELRKRGYWKEKPKNKYLVWLEMAFRDRKMYY